MIIIQIISPVFSCCRGVLLSGGDPHTGTCSTRVSTADHSSTVSTLTSLSSTSVSTHGTILPLFLVTLLVVSVLSVVRNTRHCERLMLTRVPGVHHPPELGQKGGDVGGSLRYYQLHQRHSDSEITMYYESESIEMVAMLLITGCISTCTHVH